MITSAVQGGGIRTSLLNRLPFIKQRSENKDETQRRAYEYAPYDEAVRARTRSAFSKAKYAAAAVLVIYFLIKMHSRLRALKDTEILKQSIRRDGFGIQIRFYKELQQSRRIAEENFARANAAEAAAKAAEQAAAEAEKFSRAGAPLPEKLFF